MKVNQKNLSFLTFICTDSSICQKYNTPISKLIIENVYSETFTVTLWNDETSSQVKNPIWTR